MYLQSRNHCSSRECHRAYIRGSNRSLPSYGRTQFAPQWHSNCAMHFASMCVSQTVESTKFSAVASIGVVYASARISFFVEFPHDPGGSSYSPWVYHRKMQSAQCAPHWMHRLAAAQIDRHDSIGRHKPNLNKSKRNLWTFISTKWPKNWWNPFVTRIVAAIESVQAIFNIERNAKFTIMIIAVELIFCSCKDFRKKTEKRNCKFQVMLSGTRKWNKKPVRPKFKFEFDSNWKLDSGDNSSSSNIQLTGVSVYGGGIWK